MVLLNKQIDLFCANEHLKTIINHELFKEPEKNLDDSVNINRYIYFEVDIYILSIMEVLQISQDNKFNETSIQ